MGHRAEAIEYGSQSRSNRVWVTVIQQDAVVAKSTEKKWEIGDEKRKEREILRRDYYRG
jgi:hypothetical protein